MIVTASPQPINLNRQFLNLQNEVYFITSGKFPDTTQDYMIMTLDKSSNSVGNFTSLLTPCIKFENLKKLLRRVAENSSFVNIWFTT